MSKELLERIMILEKENRRMHRKIKQGQDAYKTLEAEKIQIEEDSYKEKALPAHYENIEEKLDYYKDMVNALSLENSYLEERMSKGNFGLSSDMQQTPSENLFLTEELQQKVASQKDQLATLSTENKQLKQELRVAKSEIAEVLIDAKMHARKIIETADGESRIQRNTAKREMDKFTIEVQEVQQEILKSKLDITRLFEEIDLKLSAVKKIEMNQSGGNSNDEK